MSLSPLPLSYCTNVHPGQTVDEVLSGLETYTGPLRQRVGRPVAAGLWLARTVIDELLQRERTDDLKATLDRLDLQCYTLNAFPFGDFHSERVKEQVYLPDWSDPERLRYTLDCAEVLAKLLPDETGGSISTVPLGFKPFRQPEGFTDACVRQLRSLAGELKALHDRTGRQIIVAIEPEPFCVLETTTEAITFFDRLRDAAASARERQAIETHLGLCYDVCHQSVEFEDVRESIRSIDAAGIPIGKVHITCAIEADNPTTDEEVRAALVRHIEPRYLHQTFAMSESEGIVHSVDLTQALLTTPPPAFETAAPWRVHYHVPVNAETIGPLRTTRPDLKIALKAIAELDQEPHLEIETYTWSVLPGQEGEGLVTGLAREFEATRLLLDEIDSSDA